MRPPNRRAVAAAIAGATPPSPPPASPQPPTPPLPDGMAKRFKMNAGGLYRRNGKDDGPDLWICDPFEVLMQTRDAEATSWGLLLHWHDQDGNEHSEAIPRSMFAGESAELRSRLADGGLRLNPRPNARQALTEYLAAVTPPKRAVCVPRGGWHVIGGRRVFMLPPDQVFGDAPEKVILQTATREPGLFGQGGTLEGWKSEIGARCAGNSRLVFAVCTAFAAPLLELLGEDGSGIHFYGSSRAGKTTLLRVAASVCGGTPEAGAAGYVRTWRSTGNAIEGTAAAHSDALLPLDEIGQADGRDIGETAYLLGNGQGKARMDRGAGLRAPIRFRVLFLSTGEQTLAAKITEAGKAMRAGMETRMIDLPAEPASGGVFESWPIDGTPEALARALGQAVRVQYGTPLRGFLHHLVQLLAASPELAQDLKHEVKTRVTSWMAAFPNASSQVSSVADRFGLLALAGTMATEAGLTGWAEGEADRASRICLLAWLAARGSAGAREEMQAIEQLRAFISCNGGSRFEDWREPVLGAQDGDTLPPPERFRTVKRAGWRRWIAEGGQAAGWLYYLTRDGMAEALTGLEFRSSVGSLAEKGFILAAKDGRSSTPTTVPGYAKARLYRVPSRIIGATGDGTGPPDDEPAEA